MAQIPSQQQPVPGRTSELRPQPDHGEDSYVGTGKFEGKSVVLTGGDSGIGRAIAIAFAREGADILISYLEEHDDAKTTASFVEKAGRKAVLVDGDLRDPQHCRDVVAKGVDAFGRIDVLIHNAAFQMSRDAFEDIPDEEWSRTIETNLNSFFHLTKAAIPHIPQGGSVLVTSSINSDDPRPDLAPYDATKSALANLAASLGKLYAKRGIRFNSVAPGPIWTPLIPSTLPPEDVENFGTQSPMGRAGQPAEVAPVFVFLASDAASYVTGARYAVTGGSPML